MAVRKPVTPSDRNSPSALLKYVPKSTLGRPNTANMVSEMSRTITSRFWILAIRSTPKKLRIKKMVPTERAMIFSLPPEGSRATAYWAKDRAYIARDILPMTDTTEE